MPLPAASGELDLQNVEDCRYDAKSSSYSGASVDQGDCHYLNEEYDKKER